MSADLPGLLYDYFHTYDGSKEKNEIAEKLWVQLGVGLHNIGGRTIEVLAPEAKDGWTKYAIREKVSDA